MRNIEKTKRRPIHEPETEPQAMLPFRIPSWQTQSNNSLLSFYYKVGTFPHQPMVL